MYQSLGNMLQILLLPRDHWHSSRDHTCCLQGPPNLDQTLSRDQGSACSRFATPGRDASFPWEEDCGLRTTLTPVVANFWTVRLTAQVLQFWKLQEKRAACLDFATFSWGIAAVLCMLLPASSRSTCIYSRQTWRFEVSRLLDIWTMVMIMRGAQEVIPGVEEKRFSVCCDVLG